MARKLTYFLNSLSGGGAENGLITLIDNRLFEEVELYVLAINLGDGKILSKLQERLPATHLKILSHSPKMGVLQLVCALFYYPWFIMKTGSTVAVLSLEQANIIGRFWAHLMPWVETFSFEHNIKYSKRIYGTLLKILSLPVKGMLCDSKRTEQAVRENWFIRKTLPAVTLPLFRVTSANISAVEKPLHDPLRLVVAGRLIAQKNQKAILQAMAKLREEGCETQLTLFGEGPDQEMLEALTAQLNLEGRVIFAGYKADWSKTLHEQDIYLQPSDYEGLCITLLEAMETGIPCIASPVGEISVYGKHEHNILLLEKADGPQIAHAVSRLFKDKDVRIHISRNAVSDIHQSYGDHAVRLAVADARRMMKLND